MPAKIILSAQETEQINNLFHSDLGVHDVCKTVGYSYGVVNSCWKRHFTKEDFSERTSRLCRLHKIGNKNPMFGKIKEAHHNSVKGRTINSLGYAEIFAPDWYTGNTDGNRVYEHIVVYCATSGITELPKGFVVHHIDHNKLNNTPDNLEMLTVGEHMRHHNTTHGRYVKY